MRYLNQSEANELKFLLLNGALSRPLRLEFPDIGVSIACDAATLVKSSSRFRDRRMSERELVAPNGQGAFVIHEKHAALFVNVGEWGYETRLRDTHVCIGTP